MATDISRIRLNPLSDYAGVELRQGAVLLDADANESTGIFDRRLRALASDVLGRARVSSTTPHAFEISAASGTLRIGRGRFYVDGLLAENHGAGAPAFDPLLAERVHEDTVAYDAQPYLPDPPPLPTTGRHIVYLDAWYRDVTHVEAPDLVEIAVGVETSSRTQVVWQVRLLEVDAGVSCDTSSPAWEQRVAPSSGLLTTGTFDDPAVADPCELPPSGGYRGLENQTYRIEIHAPGQPGGGATFKWSRENASVVAPVQAWVTDRMLQLQSLGRDDVLGFKTGDWVEFTDDARELAGEPGEMRRITVGQERHVSFADPLPAAMGLDPIGRRLRAIRWDQGGKVFRTDASGTPVQVDDLDGSAAGTIAVPAAGTRLLLENGVTVAFDTQGTAGLRAGDFWVFAARTADASVERLDKASPQGRHHHYARLALWDAGTGTVSDCRQAWPPATGGDDCACSACVTPREARTLQAVVDKLRAAGGGTICLDIGEYVLDEPLVIANLRSLRIVGKGSGTVLRAARGSGVLRVEEKSEDIVLSAFSLQTGEAGTPLGILRVADSNRIGLDRLTLHGPLGDVAAVELGGEVTGLWMRDCVVNARVGLRAPRGAALADLRVEANAFQCDGAAIDLDKQCSYVRSTRLVGNRIECGKGSAISLAGKGVADAVVDIEGNVVIATDCIESTLNRLRIAGNTLQAPEGGGRFGILLTAPDAVEDLMASGNRIVGFDDAMVIKSSIQRAMIGHNQIDARVNGITLSGAELAKVMIEANQVRVAKGAVLRVQGRTGSVAISANQVEARNRGTMLVVDSEAMACGFDGNQCDVVHAGDVPAVRLHAGSVVAASNRIRGKGDGISLLVETHVATVLGNIVRGSIKPASAPWAPLNVEGAPD